jgi:hypothetical protein
MEKRSRRRIRDLVALAAFQGLSENEIGCARISMMARSDAAPNKGRIQKRKTNRLQIIKSSLQRTAREQMQQTTSANAAYSITSSARTSNEGGTVRPSALAVFMLMMSSNLVGCSTGRSAGLAPLRILST